MSVSDQLSRNTPRLIFLDCVRGLAAIAVVIEHAGAALSPAFAEFHTTTFQLGQFGVSLFFLCSGFVIPYSLERKPSLKRFWIGRIFRLYPLYWLSLAAAFILAMSGALRNLPEQFATNPVASWLVNLTMIQGFLGFQHALSPYWSLGYEMIFYAMISFLFATKLHKRTALFVWLLLAIDIINPILTRFVFHTSSHLGLTFHFTVMFFGTLVYRVYEGETSKRQLHFALPAILITAVATNAIAFWGIDDPQADGVHRFLPMTLAWLSAFGVFFGAFALRNQNWIRIFLSAGTISYSIYLIHPLVVEGVPKLSSPALTAIVWSIVIWFGAKLTFKFVELPAIHLGRRIIDKTVINVANGTPPIV